MAGEVDAVHDKFGKLEFFCISVEAVAMCVTRVVVNPTAQLFPPVIHLKFSAHLQFNQLEKLEAARSAYLWLPLVTFGVLSWPYLAFLGLTGPY